MQIIIIFVLTNATLILAQEFDVAQKPQQTRIGVGIMLTEQFKPIKGYEGLYEISNFGMVKSLKRGTNNQYGKEDKILSLDVSKNGYKRVRLWHKGKFKRILVHRLVGEHFIPNPDRLPEINHLDCNPTNNYYLNLEWCTPLSNIRYAIELGRKKCKGEDNPSSKLKIGQVKEIRMLRDKISQIKIARLYGVSQPTVSAIQLQNLWRDV